MRALIAEDDFTSRLLLQSFLAKHGECHVAINGKEAVDAFRTAQESGKSYDLVCMDIMMPEMDGQTAVREIRAMEAAAQQSAPAGSPKIVLTNGTKIIMTTALDDVKNVVEAFNSLCDAYMFKPIDTAKLLGHMREFHLI